ncbi:hypothetical protein [Bacillus sp. AFS040349]|uniref:hypothetical protein n=2 Tax=Bacillaceae TaxID=186817 RepID=UPI0021001E88|nr:hypothetical protein [Bacillus sp. AFS040349]
MYPTQEQLYWQGMYEQDDCSCNRLYQVSDYPYTTYDARQFMPGFPSSPPPFTTPGQGTPGGAPMSPPGLGTPGGAPTSPPGQGAQAGPPTSPPPSFVPQQTQQAQAFAVDPGSIRRCLFRFTYVWLSGNQQFWFYPIFIGQQSISGYRWTGFRWVFFGISLRQIQSFTCV